jgi:hypothetical protein
MKNIQNLLLGAAIATTTFFSACKKEDKAPEITLDEPTEGMVVSGEVHIHGKVADEDLHNLDIKVTKDADGTELFTFSKHWHGKSEYEIDQHFTPDGMTGETAVTLLIEVEDGLDQISTKTVKFKVKP